MTEPAKLSKVEGIKDASNFLAGPLANEMVDGNPNFGHDSEVLLKFHGTYQQDDRDERGQVSEDGKKKKAYSFMVRTRIPGGILTSDQVLEELNLCDELGNTTLRITSRQAFQLHGVLKENLKRTIQRINECQLSTLAACGDVNRNVMCCPAPYKKKIYRETQALAHEIAMHFAPRTKAYHEVWLTDSSTGDKQLVGGESESNGDGFDVEPIYGKHYMPRKFKMAIGFDFDNCVDLYANDLGLMAVTDGDKIIGYNVLVGGGMGVTPSAKKTFPAVAKRLCFAGTHNVIKIVEAVFKVQRDFGNREDRKIARLKYVVANWGIEKFKAKVEEYYGGPLPEPHPTDVHGFNDHMGWDEQGDGKWFYGLNIENGRIKDTADMQLKTAIREICTVLKPGIRLTAHQSMLFTDIEAKDKAQLEAILKKYGVKLTEEISEVRRYSMACVAWPTCGLSITESERALPGMIDQLEVELARLGLSTEKFTVRMTGCPNGCARPYNCDVGLVGRARGQYTLFVGGRLLGDRLNSLYKDYVPAEEVVSTLTPLFVYFKTDRQAGETFGDFCNRKGQADLAQWADNFAVAK
ncbi:Sulfite reductase [ferredoxin] [Anatilimnocola aggregata]|uniref:Sulfite reductase [ferredoxin] n=1 Tax=Anatilimnocola aggregata TaxID=2528021 RepID=A0A517Y6T5_9BACT|nr:NADPH-dependent assimilatory sulfite reductase hemoprotein subunit [Anatilimnocola aggregata]QDU25941.1 Sulfite reductase [ferredoxin] [Anatilimnocola aggregata]